MVPKSPLSSRSWNSSYFSSSFGIPQISPYLAMGFWTSWLACVCLHYPHWVFTVAGGRASRNRKHLPFHCFPSHKNKPSVFLCWGICRGSVGSFQLAKEGRLRRLLRHLEGVVQRAEHPAGEIRELLPDLYQDQGPKVIDLFNSHAFEKLHTL